MDKFKRAARILALLLFIVPGALSLILLVFDNGALTYFSGRLHLKAQKLVFGETLSGVTRAEVYLIAGKGEALGEQFPIRPYLEKRDVYAKLSFQEKELEQLLGYWNRLELDYWRQALCHYPVYGFRFYRKDKMVFETSVCWKCNNFYIEVLPGIAAWYGFKSHTQNARDMRDFLKQRMPYDEDKASMF